MRVFNEHGELFGFSKKEIAEMVATAAIVVVYAVVVVLRARQLSV